MGNMGKTNYTNFPITHISEKMCNFAGAIVPSPKCPLKCQQRGHKKRLFISQLTRYVPFMSPTMSPFGGT